MLFIDFDRIIQVYLCIGPQIQLQQKTIDHVHIWKSTEALSPVHVPQRKKFKRKYRPRMALLASFPFVTL